MRHMGWLHAIPKPPDGTKRAEIGKAPKTSRLDQMKADGVVPAMPPNPMPHIVARLIEIGMTSAGGMGPVPLSWTDIGTWQRLTGIELSAWEARTLRQMSVVYVGEKGLAEDENRPPPWHAGVTQQERDITEAKLRMVLG